MSNAIYPNEADKIVPSINEIPLKQIGSSKWWKQHEVIEKLHMQAVINITANNDEFVKDFLIQHDKIKILLYDLISSEIWTDHIFGHVKGKVDKEKSTLPIYMALFHSTTVCGLLETSMFYQEVCESCGEEIIDLVDYVSRKINKLLLRCDAEAIKREDDELGHQQETIEFTLSMKCISVLKHICDSLQSLPISVITRILNVHDFPCLLVALLDQAPWKKTNSSGKREKYNGGKWVNVPSDEHHMISKLEGQVWLTLYQLVLNPETQRKYEFTSSRKSQLLKLRRYLNDLLLDQLPHLVELQRFLEYLAVMEPPNHKQDLIIEQVPIIYSSIMSEYKNEWQAIGEYQLKEYFTMNAKQMQEQAKRLAATYDLDVIESLIDEPPMCVHCHSQATNRCSRCQNEWYCSRPCQVKHWPKHKQLCNLLAKPK